MLQILSYAKSTVSQSSRRRNLLSICCKVYPAVGCVQADTEALGLHLWFGSAVNYDLATIKSNGQLQLPIALQPAEGEAG